MRRNTKASTCKWSTDIQVDMSIRRSRRLSLTSLIDVIFLLLLFFMLSSTFTKFSEVEIIAKRGGLNAAIQRPDILIKLSGATWRINGLEFTSKNADAELKRLAVAGAKSAVILVDEKVSSQFMVAAVESTRKTGLEITVGR